MATNFGTEIAITGFVTTIVTKQLVMEQGLIGRLTDSDTADTLHPRDVPMATTLAFDGL